MSYNITFKKSVFKDLSRLPKQEALKILDKIDQELPQNADKFPMLRGKFKGMRRFRVGDYRIIFIILDKDVVILRIYHRKDVYK